jgi:hypothetical protein
LYALGEERGLYIRIHPPEKEESLVVKGHLMGFSSSAKKWVLKKVCGKIFSDGLTVRQQWRTTTERFGIYFIDSNDCTNG